MIDGGHGERAFAHHTIYRNDAVLQRIRDLGDARIGADFVLFTTRRADTPTAPITSLPALIGTPPPTATVFGICFR